MRDALTSACIKPLYDAVIDLSSGKDVKINVLVHVIDEWLSNLSDEDRLELLFFWAGLLKASCTGQTPESSHLSAINQYCKSNGALQYIVSTILSPRSDLCSFAFNNDFNSGKNVDDPKLQRHEWCIPLEELTARVFKKSGYTILPFLCNRSILSSLDSELAGLKCIPGDGLHAGKPINIDPNNPACIRANFISSDIRQLTTINLLPHAYSFLERARSILGNSAYLQSVDCWFNFPNKYGHFDPITNDSAQSFHFDMPGINWLHFFVYLTDVGKDNGPHTFVPCTYMPFAKSSELLAKRYQRITAVEMATYESKSEIQIVGSRGTVIQARTASWHRASEVKQGYRKILQYVYAIHPFERFLEERNC